MAVFSSDELRRIAELGDEESETSTAPAAEATHTRCIMPSDADERFDSSVEVFERRGGRLHRRGESAGE